MGSPNSDYLSPWIGESSPELFDTAVTEDENEAKGTEIEADDDNRLDFSPGYALSSGFRSHWTRPWSKNTEISRNTEKAEWSAPVDNGPEKKSEWSTPLDDVPAQKYVGIVTNLSLSSWISENDTIVGAGMENLGNTCFMNSVLQCFIHTVPLLDGFLSNGDLVHSNCNKEGFCLLCALQDLIVLSLTSSVVSPRNLANNLSYISSSFQRFRQEDAHEFLQCFLDRLESCHDSEHEGCRSSQSDNIVKQIFGGCIVSNLKCCNCGHLSDTYEPSVDMSLEIEDADNLFTALYSFTKVETIEDAETKFTCEKCREQVSVEKKLSFDQAPSVAVFHLKRFKNDGSFVQKIDKHVAFPLDLDLLPFTGSGEKNDVELKYVLYAIVVHIGLTATSGHYYCFIRVSPNMWCKFDDSRVVLVHEDIVLSQEAYILFYAKEGTPWFSSFIEKQKKFVDSAIWNTSPKSVLDNIATSQVSPGFEKKYGRSSNEVNQDFGSATSSVSPSFEKKYGRSSCEASRDFGSATSSVSPSFEKKYGRSSNKASHDFGSEHSGADDNEIKHSEPVQNRVERRGSTYSLRGVSDSVVPCASNPSDVSLSKAQKFSPVLLEKINQNQEFSVLANSPNDTPSPEIYREDPPDAGFSIPRDHLRLADRMSCKRRLEKDMDNLEMKQACSFIKKTMHSSRGQQLLAAIGGHKNEASVNSKKSRRIGIV